MSEKLQQCLDALLRGQDSDTVNELFTGVLCEDDQFCRVDLQRGTANIFDEDGEEVDFIKFALSIQQIPTKGLKVVVEGEAGSREVDLKVIDVVSGKPVFWGGGFWDSNEDEWLSLELHDTTMVAEHFDFDDDAEPTAEWWDEFEKVQKVSKQVVFT